MKQKNKKIVTLRSVHTAIAAVSILGILAVLFIDNWTEMFIWLPIVIAVFYDGHMEKSDELAKQNLAKANTAAMWMLFAAFAVFGMFARNSAMPAEIVVIILSAVLAIRSILFLIFDTPFGSKEDSNA